MNRQESNSTARITAIVISDIAWTILSAAICIPSVLTSLSQANGTIVDKAFGYTSAVGTGLDWFALTTFGGVVFIHSTLSAKSKAEAALFRDDYPTWAKVSLAATSLCLGLATRAPSFVEAIKFTKDKTAGIVLGFLSAIGEAGLPALGQYLQLDLLIKFIKTKLSSNSTQKKIENIRDCLIEETQGALNYGLRLSLEERINSFKTLYEEQSKGKINQSSSEFNELIKEVHNVYQANRLEESSCCETYLRKWPRRILQSLGSLTCVGLFIMDGLLSNTTYEMIDTNEILKGIGIAFSFASLLYIAPKMAWQAVGDNYDQIYDLLGGPRKDRSFADEFYPKLAKCLKMSCAILSLLQYDEQIALTKLYVPINSWKGRFLSITNIVACSLMISASYYYMIDELLEKYSLSSYTSKDIQDTASFKNKLNQLIILLQKIHPLELSDILNEIDDPIIKNELIENKLSLNESTAFL